MPNPVPNNADTLARGAEVFRVNCTMCHGQAGRGDGGVGDALVKYKYARPANLGASAVQEKSDGELYWSITNGVLVMPAVQEPAFGRGPVVGDSLPSHLCGGGELVCRKRRFLIPISTTLTIPAA